jgi:hypothetical protein
MYRARSRALHVPSGFGADVGAARHALSTSAELMTAGQPVVNPDRRLPIAAATPIAPQQHRRISQEVHADTRQFLVESPGN